MILLQRPDALQAFCKQCVEKGMPCSVIPETVGKKKYCAYGIRNLMVEKEKGKYGSLKA